MDASQERKTVKTVVVTGAGGYVGRRIVEQLSQKEIKIIAVDRVLPEGRLKTFGNTEFRQADLRKAEEAEKVFKGGDVILHLAANIGSLTYMEDFQADIIRDNSLIDAAVYPAAAAARIKFIVYSSSSMVFQRAIAFPYNEADLSRTQIPTNVYGFSKLSGEYFCQSFKKQYGLNYVILRYHNLYGPGEKMKGKGTAGDIHVIPALINKVLLGQYPLEILGNPNATRPFTYIDDAVQATVMLVEAALNEKHGVLNNDFNIGNKRASTILELAEIIWKISGDNRPFRFITKETTAVSSDRREIDVRKIRETIGWEATTSLEDGVKKVYESLILNTRPHVLNSTNRIQ